MLARKSSSVMLTHYMYEKSSGVVDIPDCYPQAIEQFLSHVYSGKVDALNRSNMLGLYYVADKYNMMPRVHRKRTVLF